MLTRSISTLCSLFHLVLYKIFNYSTIRRRFWWFSGKNGSTVIFIHVLFICLFEFFLKLINEFICSFSIALLLSFFFFTRKGKYYQEMKKPLHLRVKTFLIFSFLQKLCRRMKVVLVKTKMQTSLVMWFQQRVIHETIVAGWRKASQVCNTYVQELWLLWHMPFTTFKTRPWELAFSSGWVSSSLGNHFPCTGKSVSEFIWTWNRYRLADYGYRNF